MDQFWFSFRNPTTEFTDKMLFIQDTVHIKTKMRIRFLQPSIVFPLGNYYVQVSQLMSLTKQYSKDKNMLTLSDLKPEDKMNFLLAKKMCSKKVLVLLPEMTNTLSTPNFFNNNYILSAFLDKNLTINDRIY